MVIVYSKPNCVQCDATTRKLTALGVPFEKRDLLAEPGKIEQFRDAGLMQAPVVVLPDGEMFAGYRPDRLALLAEAA